MRAIFLAWLAVGCATPREAPPAAPAHDAPGRARRAIDALLRAKSVRTTFESRLMSAKSDPIVITGEAVSIAGGVAFVRYRASGGDVKRIVGVGGSAWVWHELGEEWVTAVQLGMSGAGRGVQDVRGVLATLAAHLDNARHREPDVIVAGFAGQALAAIMREHASQAEFAWEQCTAEPRFHLSGDALRRVRVQADLITVDGTSVRYEADVAVESVDRDFVLKFDVPLAEHVREAVEKHPDVPREVIDAVGR